MLDETRRYTPEFFDVKGLSEAKTIILTPEENTTTDERWERETPFLRDDIGKFLKPSPDSLLLDYGCGIGRLAKELVGKYACSVIGVDISLSMRIISSGYVRKDGFAPVSKPLCEALVKNGLRVDSCYTVWVLQHCFDAASDIAFIRQALKRGGLLYVLNLKNQAIPTNQGWITTDIDVMELLRKNFRTLEISQLSTDAATVELAESSYIATFVNDL